MNHEYTHDDDGVVSQTVDAGVNYMKRLTKFISSTLSYSYSLTNSTQSTTTTEPEQRVSLDLSASKDQNMLQFYSSYDILEKTLLGTANTRYYLPWGKNSKKRRHLYVQYQVSLTSTDTT